MSCHTHDTRAWIWTLDDRDDHQLTCLDPK